jgi:neurabin
VVKEDCDSSIEYYEIPGLEQVSDDNHSEFEVDQYDDDNNNNNNDDQKEMTMNNYKININTNRIVIGCRKRTVKFSTDSIRVFATHSCHDYDRRNEDIDPISASAEYELEKRIEKMNVFEVSVERSPDDGLGLSIIGMGVGAEHGLQKLGIFIKTITPNGAAARDGRLCVGDQIIEVDGVSLVGVTQTMAASVLRSTKGQVNFKIGREKPVDGDSSKAQPVSEITRLIQQSLEQDRLKAEYLARQTASLQQKAQPTVEHQTPKQSTLLPPTPKLPQVSIVDNNSRRSVGVETSPLKDETIQLRETAERAEKQNKETLKELSTLKNHLSSVEERNSTELRRLNEKIEKMSEQYTDIQEKYTQSINKLKSYEQR